MEPIRESMAVIQNARLFAINKPPIAGCPLLSVNDGLIDEGLEPVLDIAISRHVLGEKEQYHLFYWIYLHLG